MAKIYFNHYNEMIILGEITVDEAIEMANAEVPARWRVQVVAMLEELKI